MLHLFRKKKNRIARTHAIIVKENSLSYRLEGYNRLKDNILFVSDGGKNKVIQIESSISGECKTTVAANLAVSLGLNDKKILVMDLDFRRPRVHQLFGESVTIGLAEYILGTASKTELIKTTKYKNVDIITRGSKIYNSSLVLTADKFKNLIADLREEYDFIILDSAPVLQISDYIHISKVSDCTVFLVAYGSTKRGQVKEAIQELRKNNVNIVGTVFTMYDPTTNRTGEYYRRYYTKGYGSYGDYGDSK